MPFRSVTISSPAPGAAPAGCGDVWRALAAGFSPDEVRYMLAMDISVTTDNELDDDLLSGREKPDIRVTK